MNNELQPKFLMGQPSGIFGNNRFKLLAHKYQGHKTGHTLCLPTPPSLPRRGVSYLTTGPVLVSNHVSRDYMRVCRNVIDGIGYSRLR